MMSCGVKSEWLDKPIIIHGTPMESQHTPMESQHPLRWKIASHSITVDLGGNLHLLCQKLFGGGRYSDNEW